MTPQLILTLSPAGSLQAELPSINGGRRVVPLNGSTAQIVDTLERILHGQLAGQTRLGDAGAPTSYQAHHRQMAPIDGCPFCNLGLQHSQQQCGNSPTALKKKKSTISAATRAIVAAHQPAVDPALLGF